MISLRRGIFPVALFLMLILSALNGACQIDVPKWVDDIGGPGSNCISSAVKVDKQNNVYVTGFYNGTADFDPSSAVYNLTAVNGTFDTFVAKYTSAGKFLWAISMGGNGTDQVNSMTVDINGNAIISGQYNSNSMAVGTITLQNQGDWDGFMVKLNTNGGVVWAKSLGGSSTDYGGHVSSDSQGNIIENLRYESSVNIGGNTFTSQGGSFNGLTIKYNAAGTVLWALNLADQGVSQSMYSEFDSQNNVIVCGSFQENDNFNPLGTPFYLNGNGNASFVAKYNPSGVLIWAQSFNGNVVNNNTNLCINSNNDIYVDGPFSSPLTFGTTTLNNSGSQDIFIAKYSSAGVFESAGDIGGYGSIYNYGILSSKDNYIYISGYFSGIIDFDPSPTSVANVSDHGQQDFFLAKYDSNLNYKWAFNGGNSLCSSNLGRNVAIDGNNNVLFTGGFCSTVNFSASTCNPYNVTAQSGSRDCFLAQYTQSVATAAAQITAFTVPQQSIPTVIDQTNLKITVTVPNGTNVNALVPTIAYSNNITLSPASGAAQNFSAPVTYTLSSSCTSLNYTVNVVVDNSVVPVPDTICSGTSTTLAGSVLSPAPTSYTWQLLQNTTWVNAVGTINAPGYQTATFTNSGSSPVNFSFRRQVIAQGVTSYDSYYNLTVLPPVTNNTITAPAIASFCTTGNPATINGTIPTGGNGTYTYQWQSSADSINFVNIAGITSENYTPPTLNAATYYRRVVLGGPCATTLYSNIVSIKILAPPVAPVITTPTQYICAGSSATFKIANPQTGITYNWYSSSAKTTLLFTGTTYVTSLLTGDAVYYVDAENAVCASTSVATAQVITEPLPSAPQIGTNAATICSGNYIIFTDTTPLNGYFNWYTVPTGGTPIATGETYTTPPITANITYYLESENENGCISATRTRVDITVVPLPSSPQAQAPVLVCPGSSAVINVPGQQPGYTYNWYTAATGGTAIYSGNSFTTPVITTATTYYIEAINATGCPSASRTAVQVNLATPPVTPVPVAAIVTVCTGNAATLSVASPQAGLTYSWYDSAAQANLLFTGTSYTTVPLYSNTTYYVGANNGTCASAVASVQVNVGGAPPAAPAVTNNGSQTCSGSQITLSITNPQAGLTYNWYTTATGGTPAGTGNTYTTPALTANVSYYAEAVNSNGCTSGRTESDIAVLAQLFPPGTESQAYACIGSTVVINVDTPLPGLTYNWYLTATGGTPVFTGTSYTTPPITVDATFYVEALNGAGCVSTRTGAPILASSSPQTPIPASPTVTICTGSYATLLIANPQAGVTYNWYDSPAKTNLLFTGTGYTTGIINANTTFYFEATNGTCSSPAMASVQVFVTTPPATPVLSNNAPQICAGSTVTLSINSPQAGLTYNWYTAATGGTPVATGTTFTSAALTANTSYFAEAANTTGCASLSRAEADVTIIPLPNGPGTTTLNTCSGSTTTIYVNNPQTGITYNWYTTATGGTPVYTGITYVTPPLTASTTYYAEAVNASGCATFRTASPIQVNQAPATPVPTAATLLVCTGSAATLSVSNAQAGISYNWYDSAAKTTLLFTGLNYTTNPVTANATYYVEALNGTCPSPAMASVQVNVTIPPATPVLTNGTLQICAGSTVTLSVTSPQAGLTYNWYTTATGGTAVATGATFTSASLSQNISYYAEAATSGGCTSTTRAEADITVDAIPASPGMAANSICPGSTATINITPVLSGLTYNWYTTATGGTSVFTGTTYITPALTTQTTFYAEAVNAAGCPSTRTGIFVIVNAAPATPTPSNAIQSVCAGGLATLSVANPQPGITYNWYDSASKTNLLASGPSYTTGIINANTTFYVDAENSSCTSPSVASVQVNVVAAPIAPVINNLTPQVCPGSSVTMSIANPQPGYTYDWFTNSFSVAPVYIGTSYTVNNVTINSAYVVQALNSSECGSSTPVDITVIPIPAPPQIQTLVPVCVGSSTSVNIASPQSSLTYNWYDAATGGTLLFTGTTYNIAALNTAETYYVEAVNSIGCPSTARTVVQVTPISPPATPVPVLASQNICLGGIATLSVASPQSGITYNWYGSATKANLLASGPTYTTNALNANTTFYVDAENGSCPGTSVASVQVNVVAAPVGPDVNNSMAQACYGSQFTSSITNVQAGFTYNWYTVSTGGTAVYTGTTFTTPALTANITYYAEAVNSTGCPSPSRTPVSITVLPGPPVPVIGIQGAGVCPGTSTTLSATVDPGNTALWYATATGGAPLATGTAFTTPALNATTTYYVQVINSNNCASSVRAAATVTVLQQLAAPVVTVGATTATSVTFEWSAVDGATGYQVSTDGGATFTAPSSGNDGLSHTVTGLVVNQSVTIIVQAMGSEGCQLSGSSTAVTGVANYPPNDIIYVANTFTPNGDGKNDIVYVHGNSIKSMSFFVYDQWGELLFRSNDLSVGWDGTYKGAKEPVGVYVYYVQAVMSDGQRLTKKGTITLLR